MFVIALLTPRRAIGVVGRFLVALAAVLTFAAGQARAITFVPAGPQASLYEKWAAEAHVPTYPGVVTIEPHSFCPAVEGCSVELAPGQFGSYADNRDTFYFELGHLFDWGMLKGSQRRMLSREWDSAGWHWADTQAGILAGEAQGVGVEDGLEGMFAMVYQDCAWGHSTTNTGYVESIPDSIHVNMPSIFTGNFNTCAFVRRVSASSRSSNRRAHRS